MTAATKFTDADGDEGRPIDPGTAEDQRYKQAYGPAPFGTRPRSTYVDLIGESPECKPGDREAAKAYLERIERAIEHGGWSSGERTRLYRKRDLWALRAKGLDARFQIAGTKAGRLDPKTEQEVEALGRRLRAKAAKEAPRPSRKRRRQVDWSAFDVDEGDSTSPRDGGVIDADMPIGYARGGPEIPDLEGDVGDDETGEKHPGRRLTDADFLVPGQDQKGHSHRIQCRIMPAHFRALTRIYQDKHFPFRTLGDIMRWGIWRAIKELERMEPNTEVQSIMAQADAIMAVLRDEQANIDFAGMFDAMSATINQHLAAQATGEARRLTAIVKGLVEKMPEGYWRDRYLAELKAKFGHLLSGEGVQSVRLT
jgi:hypothetical protein